MDFFVLGTVMGVFLLTVSITSGAILYREGYEWTGILIPILLILIVTIGMPVYQVNVKDFESYEDIVVCRHDGEVVLLYDGKRNIFKKVTDEYLVENIFDTEKIRVYRQETRPLLPTPLFPVPNSIQVERKSNS